MLSTVYFNGQYLDQEDARLHVSDLSILRGYGVFDYFRYADGRPRFIDDHLRRFRRSAALLHLPLSPSDTELAEVVQSLIDRNGIAEGGIRFVLTGGFSPDGYTPREPNLLALPYPFAAPPDDWYDTGVTVYLHRYARQLPEAKTIDYVEGIRIQPILRKVGAQYPLYVDGTNHVRESDRSNYMIFRDGTLITPRENILLGITRQHLLAVARAAGIPTAERAVSVDDLLRADEAIICSSVKGAMPITKVVGGEISDDKDFGSPGPLTRKLMAAWREYV